MALSPLPQVLAALRLFWRLLSKALAFIALQGGHSSDADILPFTPRLLAMRRPHMTAWMECNAFGESVMHGDAPQQITGSREL